MWMPSYDHNLPRYRSLSNFIADHINHLQMSKPQKSLSTGSIMLIFPRLQVSLQVQNIPRRGSLKDFIVGRKYHLYILIPQKSLGARAFSLKKIPRCRCHIVAKISLDAGPSQFLEWIICIFCR